MGTALFRYMSLGSRDPLDDALGGMFGIYELLPAFVFSVIVIVAVSLLTAEPDAQIEAEFDKVKAGKGLQ